MSGYDMALSGMPGPQLMRSEVKFCASAKLTDRDVPIMRMIIKRKVLLMSAKKLRQRKTKFRLRERQAVLCDNGIKITD